MKLSRQTLSEFIRFNIVGIINTAFTYGVFSLTYFLTKKSNIAVCFDYGIGICSSYLLNKCFTFKSKEHLTWGRAVRMVLSYVPSLVLNIFSLHILIGIWHWNAYLAQLLTAGCIAYISFMMQKYLVFTKRTDVAP